MLPNQQNVHLYAKIPIHIYVYAPALYCPRSETFQYASINYSVKI